MKSKLTLSLSKKTISEAKQIAKKRKTTVSALFTESLQSWQIAPSVKPSADADVNGEMADLLGVFSSQPPFDARSARIREKYG